MRAMAFSGRRARSEEKLSKEREQHPSNDPPITETNYYSSIMIRKVSAVRKIQRMLAGILLAPTTVPSKICPRAARTSSVIGSSWAVSPFASV